MRMMIPKKTEIISTPGVYRRRRWDLALPRGKLTERRSVSGLTPRNSAAAECHERACASAARASALKPRRQQQLHVGLHHGVALASHDATGARKARSRRYYLHNPFGVQSGAWLDAGCEESWRMRTRARRFSLPVAVRYIGSPPGTMT